MKKIHWYFEVIFTHQIDSIAQSIGIYQQKNFVCKYRENLSRTKKNFKKPKSTMTCIFFVDAFTGGITDGFKQRKLYSDMSLILT